MLITDSLRPDGLVRLKQKDSGKGSNDQHGAKSMQTIRTLETLRRLTAGAYRLTTTRPLRGTSRRREQIDG